MNRLYITDLETDAEGFFRVSQSEIIQRNQSNYTQWSMIQTKARFIAQIYHNNREKKKYAIMN